MLETLSPAQIPATTRPTLWDAVLESISSAQHNNVDSLLLAIHLTSTLNSAGVSLPSVDLAGLLVSHICWDNDVPLAWKFLDKVIEDNIAPPLLVLALLSTRVIPQRQIHPTSYRLYLELLKRHAFSLSSHIDGPNYPMIMKSIDNVLHLSEIYNSEVTEHEIILVQFVFSIVWQLLETSLDDEGLLERTPEKKSRWLRRSKDMEIDSHDLYSDKRTEHMEGLQKSSTAMAIEIIVEFLQHKVTSKIIYLAHRNMPSHWGNFTHQLQLLAEKSMVLRSLKHITGEMLLHLTSDTRRVLSHGCKTTTKHEFHVVMASGFPAYSVSQSNATSWSSLWLPIDLYLEGAMNGCEVALTASGKTLSGLVKGLQAVNATTWHDTFLGLWVAALRLVQRERNPSEGPVPRLETCLCILLCITTIAIADIIEEEEGELIEEAEHMPANELGEKQPVGIRRKELITSLHILADYEGLLTPPQPVISLANQAAAKAAMSVSGLTVGNEYSDSMAMNVLPMNYSGNLLHLIVEACIARNILDATAYFWPNYVNPCSNPNQEPCSIPSELLGWSTLMKGSPLTPSLVNILVATPASSLAEIERIYEIAINGSDEEKMSAATILCGASLVCGWNIQEHTVIFITKLLSPSVPPNYSGNYCYLTSQAPFLNVLLVGISSVDCMQIFSLHGLAPLLAGALMPICEAFGSCDPSTPWTLATGEEISSHAVFSNAFSLLLRLWRIHHPALPNVMGDAPTIGSQLCPEQLLLIQNSQLANFGKSAKDQLTFGRFSKITSFSVEPIFMDFFPRLKRWYRQHQECIASALSGLVPGTPVHQIVDALLNMMFRKMNTGGQPLTPATSGSSNSSGSATEDFYTRLKVPAWDILEATPFVLDAALTACAHGRLSPRELTTGLKDLADFIPASLATIVSYFAAEITRGVWKPAFMNGTDWPSPAANLSLVEQQIKKIIATTGVNVPSLVVGENSPTTLPLPLAALVSLTITYKLDKASERFLMVIGPALNSLASGCPWPCMPIIASLWAQKAKRWNDFLVFSASGTVFYHSSDAVVQLLKNCFAATLGLGSSFIQGNGGVCALLGHGFGSHISGGISPVAPGYLYLRVYRSVRNVMSLTGEILSLLMTCVRDIVSNGLPRPETEKSKKTKYGMRNGHMSLAASMKRVKLAASLGASLIWISGGLNLVQSLIKETIPSWFLSVHELVQEGGESGGVAAMLQGYALSYLAVLCGIFAWGLDSVSPASKRRPKVVASHLEFIASALHGKISLGCDRATWRAYVCGFVSLLVNCTPLWVPEIDVEVLKSLSRGLSQWDEPELALSLLEIGGPGATGAAAKLIISGRF